jgi:ParB family transcriptional regulator, chromosome partitioning protein
MRIRRFAQYLETVGTIEPINVSLLRPSQYNIRSEIGDVESLKESIRMHGLLEPVLVRPADGCYEVIAGNRRMQACKQLEWQEIPCIVRQLDDKQAYEASLIENVQRETLNPIEEAQGYKRYVTSFGYGSISELAERIGKSVEYISHRILLLNLPESILEKVSTHQLSPSAAQELVWLDNDLQRTKVINQLNTCNLSVSRMRQGMRLVKSGFDADDAFREICEKKLAKKRISAKDAVEKKTLDHSILVLRMAMTRLDSLIDDVKSNNDLKQFLIDQRYAVHQLVDNCIRMKSRIEEKRTKEEPSILPQAKTDSPMRR